MVMKMHSYLTFNGHLQYVSRQSKHLFTELQKATLKFGGWDQAIRKAKDSSSTESSRDASIGNTRSGTPQAPEGSSSSYIDPASASVLRKRLAAMASEQDDQQSIEVVERITASKATYSAKISSSITEVKKSTRPSQHPLTFYPDPSLSAIAKEYSDLQMEMISSGPEQVVWPSNITWKNFAIYQLIPTLVYELEYPRTQQCVIFHGIEHYLIRTPGYDPSTFLRRRYTELVYHLLFSSHLVSFQKVATFGTFALLYTVTEAFILPLTPTSEQSFLRSLLDLALPFMVAYILLFYIIFGVSPCSSLR